LEVRNALVPFLKFEVIGEQMIGTRPAMARLERSSTASEAMATQGTSRSFIQVLGIHPRVASRRFMPIQVPAVVREMRV